MDIEQAATEVVGNDCLIHVKTFLKQKDGISFKKYVLEERLSDQTVYWDVCTEVCLHLTEDNAINHKIFLEACEMCLMCIVTNGNPKEILLALLEQCEFQNNDIKYSILLMLTAKTLLRLPNKRFHSLDLALETFSEHLFSLSLPEDSSLEHEERKLLYMCAEVTRINSVLDSFLQFLDPFVKEVSLTSCRSLNDENVQAQINVLKICLLKLLNYPIIYLDLHFEQDNVNTKNNSYVLIEKLMDYLKELETNFQKMIELAFNKEPLTIDLEPNFRKTDMEIENAENERRLKGVNNTEMKQKALFMEIVPIHSLCCLSYLIHSEGLGSEKFPCVYSNAYLLEFNLNFINEMLISKRLLIILKGIKLLISLVAILSSHSLPGITLDNPQYLNVLNNLIQVMLCCSVKELRQNSVTAFTSFVNLFQADGRYLIYQNILNLSKHSGVNGFVINLVKDDIKETLDEEVPNKFFLGSNLQRLLRLTMVLPDGETTDLLQHSDAIITVLNLVRYLVIRDQPVQNKSGIWNNLKDFETNFFKPLRVGLDMSKAHYDLELKKILQGKKKESVTKTDLSVTVEGANLPQITKQEELSVIHSALNTFDLIDSLLTRLTELVSVKNS